MDPYLLLKALHVLFIVTWLGVDTGVFTSSFWVRNPKYSIETRLQMGRLAGMLDMGPRSSLILIFAVGVILAYSGGWMHGVPLAVVVVIVVACGVWLWAVWQQYFTNHALLAGHNVGGRIFFVRGFRTFDLYLRAALATVLIAAALAGFAKIGPVDAGWLNVKLALFGGIIILGLIIRVISDPFVTALGEIARQGSTPERESRLSNALTRVYPVVVGLWCVIVVMLVLGVTKPF